jgi:hypothetical protein
MLRQRSTLRVALATLFALLASAPLARAALAGGGDDPAGGSVLLWLTVIACVGVAVATVVFYVYARRRR